MQLYELDGDPRRKEFLDDLFSFMQKRGEFPSCAPTLCPHAHPVPTLLHHTHLAPPTSPPRLGLISLPLISAPRSRLRLSCWLIFNPSAQQGQTCWTGSSACSPPSPPSLHPSHPDLQPLPTQHPDCVPPLPIPWVIAGGKAPHCAFSLPRERPWGREPGVGRAEIQACSCSRVWFLRGKQCWKC